MYPTLQAMRRASVALIGLSALTCSLASAQSLDALTERYFEKKLELSPVFATYIGDERYNDRLENPASPKYAAAQKAIAEDCLAGAKRIDPNSLDAKARLTYDVLVEECQLALEEVKFPGYLLPLDQMYSMSSLFAVFGSGQSAQPFRNAKDYENFLKRSKGFVEWVDQSIASMREGAKRGVTQPRVAMVKVVPQLREVAVEKPEDSIFWQAVKAMPASIPAAERTRLTAAYRTAISQDILPAYRRLADFIEKEYLPQTRTTVAWTALPEGKAWYAFQVRAQTTTDMTPEAIHELGLREVARIRGEMEAVKRQVGFKGDLHAFFKHLQDDPKFYFDSSEDVVAGFRQVKKRIDALLPKLFSDFPKADYEVRAVEPFRAASSAGAFYDPPSADGSRPGIFYVNTYNLKAQPKFGVETLSLHEAAPGHHFQIAIQQEVADLPRFRRFGGYNAYQEGWALYAESIGKELGVFTDPYQWYGRLSDEMLRAMRLVVDTGLHIKGWSREQAVAYMLDNSSLAESDVIAEVERYIVRPAQALGYKVGQIRIAQMRAKAEKALGPKFNVKAFHSAILRDGAMPLDVLEKKMDRWIAAQT
jgi:uncharacterized protein (DUF885 family)